MLDELDSHTSKRGKEDLEAIGVIDRILQEWEKSGPKDRAAIIKALDKCFTEKRQEKGCRVVLSLFLLSTPRGMRFVKQHQVPPLRLHQEQPVVLGASGLAAHQKQVVVQCAFKPLSSFLAPVRPDDLVQPFESWNCEPALFTQFGLPLLQESLRDKQQSTADSAAREQPTREQPAPSKP